MKIRTLLTLAFLGSVSANAQITLTTSDLPSSGDTFRVSIGLITPAIDPVPTGANYTWDYSTLQWISQDVDTFLAVSATGLTYSVVFANIPFNNYRANQAVVGPDLPSLPQISITDVYYFYYNSSNAYDLKGFGARINTIQTPLPFNSNDRILDFPVNYGNVDSSDSNYDITIPTLGGYFHEQRRVNEADGWGTLITPFGTFNTLRVKSVIAAHDSLALTIGGFGFDLPLTTEYKWYGTNQGIPLLQINTSSTFGNEVVTSIVYRDSVRDVPSYIPENAVPVALQMNLYPNPSNGSFMIDTWSASGGSTEIVMTDLAGRTVAEIFKGEMPAGTSRFMSPDFGLNKGLYLLRITCGNETRVARMVLQ